MGLLSQLNDNLLYDFTHAANIYYSEDDIVNPFTNLDKKSSYFEIDTFTKALKKTNKPIFLSINIQSLMSKIDKLKELIVQCSNSNVYIDVIAVQETWKIHYCELIQIPGYSFYHQERKKSNGGGVGFYVKQIHSTQKMPNLSPFNEKTFETLTLEVTINKKNTYSATFTAPPLHCQILLNQNNLITLSQKWITILPYSTAKN